MTEDNIRDNIKAELEGAARGLQAADLLFVNGFFNEGVSRLYYFLLHNIRAILLTRGLGPKSHEEVLRLFSLHFIKEGTFAPKAAHILAKLMKYREEADYNPSYVFTKEDFVEFRREAEALADQVSLYLKEKGYLGK